MNRAAVVPVAVLLSCVFVSSTVAAQAKAGAQAPAAKAAPAAATPPPAAPAKFFRPIKGTATIDIIQGQSKRVGNDMVTVIKVKNTSGGAIGLLKIDEYWYDKKLKIVSGDSQPYRKPFNPGEIIEVTMKSPFKPDLYRSQYQFSHAGGDVKVTAVKKF